MHSMGTSMTLSAQASRAFASRMLVQQSLVKIMKTKEDKQNEESNKSDINNNETNKSASFLNSEIEFTDIETILQTEEILNNDKTVLANKITGVENEIMTGEIQDSETELLAVEKQNSEMMAEEIKDRENKIVTEKTQENEIKMLAGKVLGSENEMMTEKIRDSEIKMLREEITEIENKMQTEENENKAMTEEITEIENEMLTEAMTDNEIQMLTEELAENENQMLADEIKSSGEFVELEIYVESGIDFENDADIEMDLIGRNDTIDDDLSVFDSETFVASKCDVGAIECEDEIEEYMDNDDDVADPDFDPHSDVEDKSSSDDNIDHEEIVENEVNGADVNVRETDASRRYTNKHQRMSGQAYKGMKKVDGKWGFSAERAAKTLPQRKCSGRCQTSKMKKCKEVTENDRKAIFTNFWSNLTTWDERRVYVNSLIGTEEAVSAAEEPSRRKRTYTYYLRIKDERVKVCKNLFLTTFGLGEMTVYGWVEDASSGIPERAAEKKKEKSENRRRALDERHRQIRASVKTFLESLPKMESHYCRASTSKLYLESVFDSKSTLYNEYKRQCEDGNVASRRVFNGVFDSMNLSLFAPKKDLCDVCVGFETENVTKEEYDAHQNRKNESRAEKEKDKLLCQSNASVKVLTVDVQAVLLSPKLNASALYYKTKLACHNYTVFDLASKNAVCYFWHEGQCDLSANAFASCISDYIQDLVSREPPITQIIIYSDGCTYQNRNAVLANTLSHLAMKLNIEITQKILEKGHTQMEVDSVHSVIERKVKQKNIYVPQQYADVIAAARPSQPYCVKYVDHEFFKAYSELGYYSSIRPGTRVGDPVVTDIRVLHYSADGEIKYKLSHKESYQDLPRKSRKSFQRHTAELSQLHSGPLKVKRSKYDHLQSLKSVIPSDYHAFYDKLEYDS